MISIERSDENKAHSIRFLVFENSLYEFRRVLDRPMNVNTLDLKTSSIDDISASVKGSNVGALGEFA